MLVATLKIANSAYKIFNSVEAAEKVVIGWDAGSYRINVDPKGSGRCFIEVLDEETGEVLGNL